VSWKILYIALIVPFSYKVPVTIVNHAMFHAIDEKFVNPNSRRLH
jgi:hypothetical protein